MKKKSFLDLIGNDFTKTEYEVKSLKDLKYILHKQHLDLDKRLDNIYNIYPKEIEFLDLIKWFHTQGFFYGIGQAHGYYNLINQRLEFMTSHNSKIDLLETELKSLEKQFKRNHYNHILTPNNYFNEIRSYKFLNKLWIRYTNINRDIQIERGSCNPYTFETEELMSDYMY